MFKLNFKKFYNENTCKSYTTLVAFVAACPTSCNTNFAGKSVSAQNFPALFMLAKEMFTRTGRLQTIHDRGNVYFVLDNISDRAFKQQ